MKREKERELSNELAVLYQMNAVKILSKNEITDAEVARAIEFSRKFDEYAYIDKETISMSEGNKLKGQLKIQESKINQLNDLLINYRLKDLENERESEL